MKKTTILLFAASLLMTSCRFNLFKLSDSSEEDNTTTSNSNHSSNNDTSSIDLSKYEDCRGYEWFNIG